MSGSISSLRRSASSRASRSRDLARQQMRDRRARELPPDDRRALEHRALLGTQPLDAGGEQRVDGGRHLERRRARPPVVQRSPSRLSAPSCTSMRTSSPTKSGIALAGREHAPGDRGRQLVGADHVGGEARRRAGVEAGERHDVGDEAAGHGERRARVAQLGAGRHQHAAAARRCSTAPGARSRSSSSGSAHCRSSITSTTGCAAASAARKRRTTKKVSSGAAGVPASSAATPVAMRARSGVVAGHARLDRRAHGVAAGGRRRAASSARSAVGERREGRAAGRVAVRAQHGRAVAEPAHELADQARLAEAGRAEDHREPRAPARRPPRRTPP